MPFELTPPPAGVSATLVAFAVLFVGLYSVGWFKLKDGSKALLALTSRRDVLYVPTTYGFVVLLSPSDPQRVLSELQAAQSRGLSG